MAYIDREKFIAFIDEKMDKCGLGYVIGNQLKHYINEQPTADVQEGKHGEWKEIKCGDEIFDYYFKCSNCGNTTPPKAFPVAPDYCPHCGAKMDGGNAE